MLYKKLSYKWVSLADAEFSQNHLFLESFDFSLVLDTERIVNTFSHWEIAHPTLARGREYIISGSIATPSQEERNEGIEYLSKIICPEGIISKNPYYRLEWEDFNGKKFWTMARVLEWISYDHSNASDFVSFSFTLFSEKSYYFVWNKKIIPLDEKAVLGYGLFSWDSQWVHLWYIPEWGNISSWTILVNEGNFEAPVVIEDRSGIEDNEYLNISNWLRYSLSWTAHDRKIDTNTRPTTITDFWNESTAKRLPWSTGFLLSPWENRIASWRGIQFPENSITISYYDTYI